MKFANLAIAATLGIASIAASGAHASVYTVEAITPFSSWLDTGLDLNPAMTYSFTVENPATIWSAGSELPYSRDSTANGIDTDPAFSYYGQWTMAGFTANYGALVGDAGGALFLIGTGPVNLKGLSGELTVGYWDSDYSDNSGFQTLSVAAVPEASTWAMMMLGFGIVSLAAFSQGKRKRASYRPV
jgi:hypothetical protein